MSENMEKPRKIESLKDMEKRLADLADEVAVLKSEIYDFVHRQAETTGKSEADLERELLWTNNEFIDLHRRLEGKQQEYKKAEKDYSVAEGFSKPSGESNTIH